MQLEHYSNVTVEITMRSFEKTQRVKNALPEQIKKAATLLRRKGYVAGLRSFQLKMWIYFK